MNQLPSYRVDCKTHIVLIFKNVFKVASLSCYIIVTVKILELPNNLSKTTQSFTEIASSC